MDRCSVQNTTCWFHYQPGPDVRRDSHSYCSAVSILRHPQPLPPSRPVLALLRRRTRTHHLPGPGRTGQVPGSKADDGGLAFEEPATSSSQRRPALRVPLRLSETLVGPSTMASTSLPHSAPISRQVLT